MKPKISKRRFKKRMQAQLRGLDAYEAADMIRRAVVKEFAERFPGAKVLSTEGPTFGGTMYVHYQQGGAA